MRTYVINVHPSIRAPSVWINIFIALFLVSYTMFCRKYFFCKNILMNTAKQPWRMCCRIHRRQSKTKKRKKKEITNKKCQLVCSNILLSILSAIVNLMVILFFVLFHFVYIRSINKFEMFFFSLLLLNTWNCCLFFIWQNISDARNMVIFLVNKVKEKWLKKWVKCCNRFFSCYVSTNRDVNVFLFFASFSYLYISEIVKWEGKKQ